MNQLSPFAESTIASVDEHLETARELIVIAADTPAVLRDVLEEIGRAQSKVKNLLALVEEERCIAARRASEDRDDFAAEYAREAARERNIE